MGGADLKRSCRNEKRSRSRIVGSEDGGIGRNPFCGIDERFREGGRRIEVRRGNLGNLSCGECFG